MGLASSCICSASSLSADQSVGRIGLYNNLNGPYFRNKINTILINWEKKDNSV